MNSASKKRKSQNLELLSKIFEKAARERKEKLVTDSTGQILIPGSRTIQKRPKLEILLIQWKLQEGSSKLSS